MHDLPAKNYWTGTRTITAAGNRTCIITLRLSDFKSQTSLTLLLRHYELTNESFSYFLTHQSKTKMFIDLKVTRKAKPTRNGTRPYLNEIPVIGVNLFQFKLMRFHLKKKNRIIRSLPHYLTANQKPTASPKPRVTLVPYCKSKQPRHRLTFNLKIANRLQVVTPPPPPSRNNRARETLKRSSKRTWKSPPVSANATRGNGHPPLEWRFSHELV